MSTTTEVKNTITLKGSAKIICEYLNFAVNSILYQRGIYPPETFKADEKYGVSLLMSTDPKIVEFIRVVLSQLEEWIAKKSAHKISLVVQSVNTKENIECWDFDVALDRDVETQTGVSNKPLDAIQKEIRNVLLQIISTISILPCIDDLCGFDILVYTQDDALTPHKWDEHAPVEIARSQTLQLRSFDTGLHKVSSSVRYRMDE